jgi:hypothetical protein
MDSWRHTVHPHRERRQEQIPEYLRRTASEAVSCCPKEEHSYSLQSVRPAEFYSVEWDTGQSVRLPHGHGPCVPFLANTLKRRAIFREMDVDLAKKREPAQLPKSAWGSLTVSAVRDDTLLLLL